MILEAIAASWTGIGLVGLTFAPKAHASLKPHETALIMVGLALMLVCLGPVGLWMVGTEWRRDPVRLWWQREKR